MSQIVFTIKMPSELKKAIEKAANKAKQTKNKFAVEVLTKATSK